MKVVAVGTGYEAIDTTLDGLCAGELLVIAGRPGMGKSSVASDIAVFMAKNGVDVLYIDLELVSDKITSLASEYIRSRSSENETVFDHLEVERLNFPANASSLCRTIYENDWADVVIIDYIQVADVDPYTFDAICKMLFPDKAFIWCSMLPRPKRDPRAHRQTVKDLNRKLGFTPDSSVILYQEYYYSGDDYNQLEMTTYVGGSSVHRVTSHFPIESFTAPYFAALNAQKEATETEESNDAADAKEENE